MAQADLANPPSRLDRILFSLPLIGRIAREIAADVDNFFWLLPVVVLGLVLAVMTWGLAALTIAALCLVPLMFVFFVAISWPS
ncbi:hypothetical protein [Pseudogemmobacter sonorensis]|uniref:hypothetical protein n=1 Tax=Pseudogemmobacter sonorensis TaxID=2989681 RepID=UPI0036C63BCC